MDYLQTNAWSILAMFVILGDNYTDYKDNCKSFANKISNIISQTGITFIIGGVYGLDNSILEKADFILSFSDLTFTHQMIRLLLSEQIYRAFTIMKGKKYHY